jgi:ribosome-binding protein aMBF1 (putative translation factor)
MTHKLPEEIVADMRDTVHAAAQAGTLTQVDLAVVIQAQSSLLEYLDQLLEQPSLVELAEHPTIMTDKGADVITELLWKGK